MSTGTFSFVSQFFQSLNGSEIFDQTMPMARFIATTISPALLLVAIFIRIMETQIDGFSGAGQGRWATAVKDIVLWGTVLAVYFAIGNLLVGFINQLYASMRSLGSLKVLMDQMAQFTVAANHQTSGSFWSSLGAWMLRLPAFLAYYFSLVVLITLNAFVIVAQALAYSFGFAYGLIAIPISISSRLRLLRGFGMFMGFVLLWPIVQAMLLALVTPLFTSAAQAVVQGSTQAAGQTDLYLLFTVLNLLASAVIIAAPFVANALAANAPAGAAMAAPFVGAAIAAGVGLARGTEGMGRRGGQGAAGRLGALRVGGGPGPGGPRAPAAAPQGASRGGPSPQPAGMAPASTGAGPEVADAGSAPAAGPSHALQRKRAQTRRGVMVRRQLSKRNG